VRPSKIEKVAGSGNKFIHMAEDLSEYYLNFVPGFKNWDMCASEAIIASRFGIVTNAKKQPLIYCPESNYTMREGIIAAKNKGIYDLCQERIE
jgi:3'-phosphoadenosine 5'-phosphosulfate (PAPS) 3'-phosphatase